MDFKGLSDPVVLTSDNLKKPGFFSKIRPPSTNFFKSKRTLGGLVTVLLLFAISIGVYLSQKPTQLVPHADVTPGIACLENGLSITQPAKTAPNVKKPGTSLVFWDQPVARDAFYQKATECGVEILNPTNFMPSQVKQLVETVTGAPASSTDATKYRYVMVEGPCNATKIAEYQNAGHTILTDIQCEDGGLDEKVNQYYGPGSGSDPFEVKNGIADGGNGGYPVIIVSGAVPVSPPPYKGNIRTVPSGSCTISAGDTCSVNVIWDVSNINHSGITTEIRVRETGVPFLSFGGSIRGEANAPWITESGYNFDLYVDNLLYDSIFVKGVSATQSPSPSPSADASPSTSPSPSPSASPSPSPSPSLQSKGDGNGDGKVDLMDLSMMYSKWSPAIDITSNFELDFNDDKKINSLDLFEMNKLLKSLGIIKGS